jgi:ParB/RepB/Spo0J family partition protein
MSKSTNRLPPVTPLRGAPAARSASEPANSVVRNLISQRLGEKDKQRNDEAFLLPIQSLVPNPNQPRQTLDQERDAELAQDIAARGILEPLLVRPLDTSAGASPQYQIIAGERRYRAALSCELEKVPVIIKNYDDEQARAASLVENLQRQDLAPVDEGRYFQIMLAEYNMSLRDIADFIHRSHSYVSARVKAYEQSQLGESELAGETFDTNPADNSEKSNKRNEKIRKLQKSQSDKISALIKPIARFSTLVQEAGSQIAELDRERQLELVEQLRTLREQIQILEVSVQSQLKPE